VILFVLKTRLQAAAGTAGAQVVASRKVKKPPFRPLERGLLAFLASRLPRWRDASSSST
jgi:hypothetical protein